MITIVSSFMGGQLLEELATTLPSRAALGVADAAHELRDNASEYAAYETGSLAASIYVTTHDGSDYAERVSDAESRNPKVVILPEVEAPAMSDAVVGVAAEHGLFQEYGTRYMPAHPFLTPAAEEQRANIAAHVAAHLGFE